MSGKSPLKHDPLRLPGQSADESLVDHIVEQGLFPLMIALVFIAAAAFVWYQHMAPNPNLHWWLTATAAIASAYAAFSVSRARSRIAAMKLGRQGERYVGQFLEQFRKDGFHIFHDIVIEDANIDHVLIGQKGVIVVETKTLSKPQRGACVITADSDGVFVNGIKMDRNPIAQVKAQAAWVKSYFAESGLKASVQCVVLFPGWFVKGVDFDALGTWVLEPKALPAFVEKMPVQNTAEAASAMMLCMANYVRMRVEL